MIVKFDALLGECQVYKNQAFNFSGCQTISVDNDLYSFAPGNLLSVTRYFDFRSSEHIKSEQRTPANTKKELFSLSNFKDE